jgi:hypothetical protein
MLERNVCCHYLRDWLVLILLTPRPAKQGQNPTETRVFWE